MATIQIPLREQIKGQLQCDIISGRFQAGQQIVERELAARFGVSHAPVREALLQLATLGLVELQVHRGARVASPPDGAIRGLFIPTRQSLETFALRNVFVVLGKRDFDSWQDQLRALRGACRFGEAERIAELDFTLHESLVSGVSEPGVYDAWLNVVARARFDPHRLLDQFPRPFWIYEQHEALLDACRRRDLEESVRVLEENIASELAGP